MEVAVAEAAVVVPEEVALGEVVEQAGDEEEDGVEVIQMAPVPVCAMASISLI
jgi:hypothetical protein